MRLRAIAATLIALALGILPATSGRVSAGEGQGSVSREDLVAVLERGSGPAKGPADAPVVVVAFSDFQCGYCRRFWQETFPQIEQGYIQTGKARLVHRHMAILGEASVQAAQASSCADEQGKFWEYHDALIRNTSPFAFTSARLKQYAGVLRLDSKVFDDCVDSKKYAKQVEAETIIGRALGATGTPAFLLNGQLLIGAYPYATFQQALDGLLASPTRRPPGQAR